MEYTTLQNWSQYLIWAGVLLSLIGGVGVKIFGDRIAKDKDIKIAEQQVEISKIRVNTESIKHSVQQRVISKEQHIALSGSLSKMNHKEITIIAVRGDPEAKNYATAFKGIFDKAGWKTNLSEAEYAELDKDLVLFFQNAHDSGICKEIKEVFHSNGIIVEILPFRGAAIFLGEDRFKPKLIVGHKAN
jgi:hypothetical protein